MKRILSRICVFHDQSAKWLLPSLGFMVVNPALWKLLLGLPFKIILIPEYEPLFEKLVVLSSFFSCCCMQFTCKVLLHFQNRTDGGE